MSRPPATRRGHCSPQRAAQRHGHYRPVAVDSVRWHACPGPGRTRWCPGWCCPGRGRMLEPGGWPIGRAGSSMISMSDVNAGELPELTFVLPTIPASAGALVRGRKGRLLILKPTYKGGWTIPGGIVEIGESPWEACRRETREESGLDVTTAR